MHANSLRNRTLRRLFAVRDQAIQSMPLAETDGVPKAVFRFRSGERIPESTENARF